MLAYVCVCVFVAAEGVMKVKVSDGVILLCLAL